jgi:hypothetical protein
MCELKNYRFVYFPAYDGLVATPRFSCQDDTGKPWTPAISEYLRQSAAVPGGWAKPGCRFISSIFCKNDTPKTATILQATAGSYGALATLPVAIE